MNYLEIIGTIVGLVYLWLEYKASIYLWIAGIVMPAIYIIVYYRAGLYADFGLNIYYMGAAVYGYACWIYQPKLKKAELKICHMPKKRYIYAELAFLAGWGIIYYILITFTDSNVPILDGFINALSIVALWMLARKYVEQWLAWIIVDAVSCGLYAYKGLFFTSGLYGLYTIIAVFGYLKWKKTMQEYDI